LIEDRPGNGQGLAAAGPTKTLILTAAVGGGHAAAGRAVRAELDRAGHRVVVEDGFRAMSPTLSGFLSEEYRRQARNASESLATVFGVTSRKAGAWSVRTAVGLLFARRLLATIRSESPDVVVSTYPLVSAALGRLRATGRMRVPAAAVIADYGVHPLWVVPVLDIHLVASRRSAELTRRAGGEAALIRMPVDPAFRSAPTRDAARTALGIPPGAFMVLVVGGAWGIGDLEGAARCAVRSGAYTVVVTGENTDLKDRLERAFGGDALVLGWTDQMPALMSAADCLIQNAGGMTCLEALEVGLPVILFSPIVGHGELNCRVMEEEGAAIRAHDTGELRVLLEAAVKGEIRLPVPKRDAAPGVVAALSSLVESGPRQKPARRAVRPVSTLVGDLVQTNRR